MKKNLSLLILSSILLINNKAEEPTPIKDVSFLLNINFPKELSKTPSLYGYYKGCRLEFEKDFCIVPENNKCANFTIVITPKVNYKTDGNNVQYLERIRDIPCKMFFTFQETKDSENNLCLWNIEELKISETTSLKIPDNSILLLVEPKFVGNISENIKKKKDFESALIDLPEINICLENSSKEELFTSFDHAALSAPDLNPIHAKIKKNIIHNQNSVISMRVR